MTAWAWAVFAPHSLPDLLHEPVDIITRANYVSFFRAAARGLINLRILTGGTDSASSRKTPRR